MTQTSRSDAVDWAMLMERLRAIGMARGLTRADACDVAQEAVCRALEVGAANVEAYAVTCVRSGRIARRQRTREHMGMGVAMPEGACEPDQESAVMAKQAWFAILAEGCDVTAARCPMEGQPETSAVRMARMRARRATARALASDAGQAGTAGPTPHV